VEARAEPPSEGVRADAPPSARPRWLVLAPFLGTPPELTARQWAVLGLVSVATLFDQYDRALFALALPQIQAGLGIGEGEVGVLGSIVRLGALPAVAVALAADRLGRRRILLFTILAYTVLTGATALAPDARTFVALQFFARIFTAAELVLAVVVIAEEFDAESRGWGIGALFALQACGVGLAAVLFPLAEALGLGWRGLYAFGLVPLALLAWWRRALPETERFEAHRRARSVAAAEDFALAPLLHLIRHYPGRFAAVAISVLIGAICGSAADFLGPKYLQDAHGWTPGAVAALYVGGGAVGIFGAALGGRWSDRFGRKPVAVAFGVAVSVLALAFYNTEGALLSLLWVAMIFAVMGSDTVSAAFGAELFPTSHRSTAAGARSVIGTLGAAIGLALESALYALLGSHWEAVTWLLVGTLAVPLVVAVAFPETAARSLEEVSPERAPR
jgi:MFS family permease